MARYREFVEPLVLAEDQQVLAQLKHDSPG